jgi:outer membrane protein TolC
LWKDFGVDINQLLSRFPNLIGQGLIGNSALLGFNQHQNAISSFVDRQTEGILISRLRFDQQRAEFERNIHILLVNAEVAYWNLYGKYGQLYSFEENLRIMHRAWQDNYRKFQAGQLPPEKYHQVRGQYEEFRGERLRALNEVIAAERELRGILGMSVEDGTRLVPTTPPTLAQLKPDWESSARDALNLRPEIILARDNIKYHQYLLQIQKNNLKPDLRAYARFEPFGDGSTLSGNGTFIDNSGTPQFTNAFRSFTHAHLADYQIGLNLTVPLGFHAEFAAIRAARLQLTQSFLVLRDQEEKSLRVLHEQFHELAHWYERIKAHRAERMGYRDSLSVQANLVENGKRTFGDPEFLEAQRRYAAALVKEYQAIAEYNNSLARLEWVKGTILRYNNVHIGEGELPQCAQVRAVEYQKERTHALLKLWRPDSLKQPGLMVGSKVTDVPPLESEPLEEPIGMQQLRPAPKSDPKHHLPPVTQTSFELRPSPAATNEVAPIRFKSSPAATPAPAPLPQLDPVPLPTPPGDVLPTPTAPITSLPGLAPPNSAFATLRGPMQSPLP